MEDFTHSLSVREFQAGGFFLPVSFVSRLIGASICVLEVECFQEGYSLVVTAPGRPKELNLAFSPLSLSLYHLEYFSQMYVWMVDMLSVFIGLHISNY